MSKKIINEEILSNNLVMFNAATSLIFNDISRALSEKEFLQIFKNLNVKMYTFSKLYKIMETELHKAFTESLKLLRTDLCLKEGMKTMAMLSDVQLQDNNEKFWRPSGDIEFHLKSIDKLIIEKELKNIKQHLNYLQHQNILLEEQIIKKRKSLHLINSRMKNFLEGSLSKIKHFLLQEKNFDP